MSGSDSPARASASTSAAGAAPSEAGPHYARPECGYDAPPVAVEAVGSVGSLLRCPACNHPGPEVGGPRLEPIRPRPPLGEGTVIFRVCTGQLPVFQGKEFSFETSQLVDGMRLGPKIVLMAPVAPRPDGSYPSLPLGDRPVHLSLTPGDELAEFSLLSVLLLCLMRR